MAGDTADPAGYSMVAGPGRRRPRRLAPGRQAGAPRLPATACAPDRLVRQSPMASSLPVQRLTDDALWAGSPGRPDALTARLSPAGRTRRAGLLPFVRSRRWSREFDSQPIRLG